jgi:hypothetical protein
MLLQRRRGALTPGQSTRVDSTRSGVVPPHSGRVVTNVVREAGFIGTRLP